MREKKKKHPKTNKQINKQKGTKKTTKLGPFPTDVVVNVQGCDFQVSEFEIQSSYYVHFRAINFWKGIEDSYPLNYG